MDVIEIKWYYFYGKIDVIKKNIVDSARTLLNKKYDMLKITRIPKSNSLFYKSDDKPFKYLVFLYKLSQILYGVDFGFFQFVISGIKIIPKVLAVVQCIIVICAKVIINRDRINSSVVGMLWNYLYDAEYFFYVLILVFIKKENTFYNLLQDIRTIDLGLKVDHASYNLEIKLFCIIAMCIANRVVLLILFCVFNEIHIPFLNSITYLIVVTATDMVRVTYAFMLYAISCRLKVIVSLLKDKQSRVLSIQYLYKSIIDVATQHKVSLDLVVCI